MGETLTVKRIEASKGLKYMVWVFYFLGALGLTYALVEKDLTSLFLGLFQIAMAYLLLFVFTYDKVIFTGEGIVMKGLGNKRSFSKQSIRAIAAYTSEVNVGKSVLMSVFAGRVTSGSVMVTRVTFHQLAEAKIGIGAKRLYITTEKNLPYSFHPTRANNKKEVIVMHWSKEVEEYLTRHYADLLV